MTLKTNQFREKNQTFLQKKIGNILAYVLNFFSEQFLQILVKRKQTNKQTNKTVDFTRFWENLKKKTSQNGKFGSVASIKQGFFRGLI